MIDLDAAHDHAPRRTHAPPSPRRLVDLVFELMLVEARRYGTSR